MKSQNTQLFSDIDFKYYETIPNNTTTFGLEDKSKWRVNTKALLLYGLYRNTVYDAYKSNPQLAKDILAFRHVYNEPENSRYIDDPCYKNPLYHYSVFACTDAMQEWTKPDLRMQAFIATKLNAGARATLGFIHFYEATVDSKPVVYIAQAGVIERGKSLGRSLMECVLKHYPEVTTFYVLTRVFNEEAKTLYGQRFKFTSIPLEEIKQLGYDERYCGFKLTTTKDYLENISPTMNSAKPTRTF